MKNKTLQFKTNINCEGCVSSVSPFLNQAEGIGQWEVNTRIKDKILTVTTEGITTEKVMETVEKAGFKIELLNS